MKYNIIFAGVGGQGIVSAASMLVGEADRLGLYSKQNEVHGMAQRGGAVVCHVRLSDKKIYSDTISKGTADVIVSTEPMEALRYLDYLSNDGTIISSNKPVKNIEYPDIEKIIGEIKKNKAIIVDADKLIAELKNEKAVNVAMLGCLLKVLNIDGMKDGILKTIEKRFAKKGAAVIEMNKKAFEFGEAAVKSHVVLS